MPCEAWVVLAVGLDAINLPPWMGLKDVRSILFIVNDFKGRLSMMHSRVSGKFSTFISASVMNSNCTLSSDSSIFSVIRLHRLTNFSFGAQ